MVDFRSREEQRRDAQNERQKEMDYKRAFEDAQAENRSLKGQITKLEDQQEELRQQVERLAQSQTENIQSLRSQMQTGINRLNDDNKKLHSLIQSAQSQDLTLVETMDKNHKDRLQNIFSLIDNKSVYDG